MEIIVPDIGHGNSVGIFENGMYPLLIDCGTESNGKRRNFTNLLEPPLKRANGGDLVITHYHFDHYSLLSGSFSGKFFNNIYLPALPQKSLTAQAMERFMALAIAARYEKYYLSLWISSFGKNIHCLVKDESFNAIGRDWEVLWPDYNIIDRINRRKIKAIFEKVDEVRENLDERQSQEFEKSYDYLSKCFSEEPKRLDDLPRESTPRETLRNEETDEEVRNGLMSIEKIFKGVANRASLVVKDVSTDFLFTGDVDDVILNNYLNFGNQGYFLIESPHHGGYYGSAFDNVSTEALIISRKQTDKPDYRFYRDLPWRILVDTAKNGNCVIQQTGRRKRNIIYLNYGTHIIVYFL